MQQNSVTLDFLKLTVTNYIAYLAMVTTAVQEMRKSDHVRIDDDEKQDPHHAMENSDHFELLLP